MSPPQIHIALLEDEEAQRILLAAYLEKAGYRVSPLESVSAFNKLWRDHPADVLLLDLNLPDGDGMKLAQELRQQSSVPIIMVTSRDRDEDRIDGLELGADDYITKPFHPRELVARIRNVLKRSVFADTERFRVGRYLVDPAQGHIYSDEGEVLKLTPGEFKLLCALGTARGRAVSRYRLAEVVGRGEQPSNDRTVDVLVSRLRRKIEVDPAQPQLLLTVPGRGYRLAF